MYLRFFIFKFFSISLMLGKRTDCNCRVGQLPASRTSTNFLHHLQRNGDLSSEVLVFASNPSTSVEDLETVYGDGSLQNIHKCTSKTCLLSKYFFKPSDHIVSTMSHQTKRSYSKHYVTSQLSLY